MKILHVIESLEFGGAEKVVVGLANALAVKAPVGVCCVKRLGEMRALLAPGIDVHCLDKGEGNDWRLPAQLAAMAATHGYDVLHSHGWGVFIEPALARHRPYRLIHTVHGGYLAYASGLAARIKRASRRWLERRVATRYDRIVTVSEAIRRDVASDLGISDERLLTIHNGIEVRGPKHLQRNDHRLTFITIGRIAEVKNQALMIAAFARIAPEFPQAELHIVGDGPQRAALEARIAEAGLGDRVRLLGARLDTDELLGAADIFLMSSRYEGISMAILEAMRAQLPVVASRVGGIPDTVLDGVTGLLFPSEDEQGMAEAMRRLAADAGQRGAMGARGFDRLQQEFSLESTVNRYLGLYRGGAA